MADMTETLGRAGLTVGEALAGEENLDRLQAALVRERVIREVMRESGEERQHVVDMLDAMVSMGQEAVLDLTEGEPTTLRDALERYVDSLRNNAHSGNLEEVADDLDTILAYPWSGEEALVALHNPNYGLGLRVENPDDEHVEIRIGNNRCLIASGNYGDLGGSGLGKMIQVAEAVYRATLARVIPDRDHHVQISSTDRRALLAWLERPNGAWNPDTNNSRVAMNAVEGGGVLVRTRPYHFQRDSALAKRR